MRKSRLVILPTKCLNQIGFLLLFLSCPVIGDWGRIQPETEASHKAIQVAREGTCGFQRDFLEGIEKSPDLTIVKHANERVESRREATVPGSRIRQKDSTKGRLDVRIRDVARRVDRREASPPRSRSVDSQVRYRAGYRFAATETTERATARIQDRTEKRQGNKESRQCQTRGVGKRTNQAEASQTARRAIVRNESKERSTTEYLASRRRMGEVDRRLKRRPSSEKLERRVTVGAERSRESPITILSRAFEERKARAPSPERRTESSERGTRVKRMASRDRRSFPFKIHREAVRYSTKDLALTQGIPAEAAETLLPIEGVLDGVFNQVTQGKQNGLKVGEWSLNCLIGVVAYYLNSKQTKTA